MTEGHTERLETALDGKYRIERFAMTSRDTLLVGTYFARDLHPDGDRMITVTSAQTAQDSGTEPATERFFVVTNWFEELRERMGSN